MASDFHTCATPAFAVAAGTTHEVHVTGADEAAGHPLTRLQLMLAVVPWYPASQAQLAVPAVCPTVVHVAPV